MGRNREKTHLIVLKRGPFDGYKSVYGKRLGMFGHTTDIRLEDMLNTSRKHGAHLETSQMRPTRSASDSPSPRIPPEQTLIPASLTLDIVSKRSSYVLVVMTCTEYSINLPVACIYAGKSPWDSALVRCQDYDCRLSSLWRAHTVSAHRSPSRPGE